MPAETVVITGAPAGVGGGTGRAFARHSARIGLLARGADRLNAAAAEVRELGGEALALPCDVADADAVDSAADAVERQLGPIDIWINNAMATIFAPVAEITPEEYRRATEVTYLGCVWGTMAALEADAAAQPWHDRTGRLGPCLPLDPVAGALLWRQARDPRLYRRAAFGADPRQQPGASDDGAIAGAQHAAIRLGAQQDGMAAATGAADLSAGGRGRSNRLCRACEAARDRCRRPDGRGDHREQSRAGAARLVPGAHLL